MKKKSVINYNMRLKDKLSFKKVKTKMEFFLYY